MRVVLMVVTAKAKDYYRDSAMVFLRRYGQYYNLFGRFIYNETTTMTERLVPPTDGSTRSIKEDYKTRDYVNFRHWESLSTPRNFTERYYREDVTDPIESYNNKFRYGNAPNDRFLDIFINENTRSVHFLGWDNNMSNEKYGCSFESPIVAFTEVVIERGFRNAVKQATLHNHIFCPLPLNLNLNLNQNLNLSQGLNATQQEEIRFHFVRGTASSHQRLISDIVVRRPHELEHSRSFNVSLSTQVDDWNEPLLVEWLVYHILVGVEHFYLFDITRTNWQVIGSSVEPFLDANIVTIIYFPFVPIKGDDHPFPAIYLHASHGVHTVELNIALYRFGHFTTFLGFQDVDEFFCPSEDLQPGSNNGDLWGYSNPALGTFSALGALQPHIPGLMFDTLEMGCADEQNYHHSKSLHRPALSTTCTITGKYFEELKIGHGKTFIKPALFSKDIKYVATPHRIDHYWVVWTKPAHGGLFYHFNRFRYSGDGISKGVSNVLRNFTLRALHNLFSLV
jgi:hypothetical protein